ncbi:Ultraviolet N-glycosylase/AP lyase [Aliarcobacter thereius]|uniref:Endonuclease III n=2 Tax=Aliarcobacter thereius TaxID=544718 RepID=A0A1C0B6G5_9BACT|nr:endonuclease III [Aliarcobacter thereius]OCL86738.1 Ultraviolet N-glycosylase/AP lyase [Aliarcobacter thereius]OCL90940.1 Ultraviolet N-glycosylase/AP lyase [Aliarcobacter thereius]OCL96231.1 Ultraviolet N-glycosylase/AP lyase [Aliarcobacter thereius LMG 24486]OCL98907.1 Ultraviolet N-glycosylase/AP lyase [Aliarcobacter thereius]QBF15804.1 endonuclease III [Aliarcobacter thereius LMG 24486]
MKKASKSDIETIKQAFLENYKDAVTELNYNNDYELLIAIILSAQCTDKRVNIITPALFEKYPNVFELSIANLEDVKSLINSCSFFNNKAKNIIKMAQSVMENYDGQIPHIQKELIKLAGVGNKTANVFMIEYKQENLMAVDTHVFRVSHRLGLSYEKTVEKTELELVKKLKGDDLHIFHQAMVLFGRYICKAVKPDCDNCYFPQVCKTKQSFKPA